MSEPLPDGPLTPGVLALLAGNARLTAENLALRAGVACIRAEYARTTCETELLTGYAAGLYHALQALAAVPPAPGGIGQIGEPL